MACAGDECGIYTWRARMTEVHPWRSAPANGNGAWLPHIDVIFLELRLPPKVRMERRRASRPAESSSMTRERRGQRGYGATMVFRFVFASRSREAGGTKRMERERRKRDLTMRIKTNQWLALDQSKVSADNHAPITVLLH